jgi:hypothetical protein
MHIKSETKSLCINHEKGRRIHNEYKGRVNIMVIIIIL